ncbi:hypothetical protein HU200_006621 [Digitaria exilis]|uniref:NB-ARC domain-containing protein n=1 Tax=Digitaria exilis TaxID=1010633 RepID=A0A835FRS8_9POAL|nr:hypothetical protein HU200_006621 [Digitaria exilis]
MVSTRGGTSSIQLNAAVTTLKDEAAASARDFALSLVNPLKRVRVAAKDGRVHEIDRVHENLQGICGDLKEFIMLLQDCQPIRQPLPTNIFVDGQMFGRHVEKERIINFLLHDCGHLRGQLGVLSTVGDIGSGKTTLVQHACDDVRVRSYFSVIMLCCTYTIKTNGGGVVLHSKHVIGDVGIGLNDPLQLFNGSFGNRRFLVVFENMDMNKKLMFEDSLLPILRWSKEGSKVIITTNNRRVASIGTVEPIILKALPFPEYWFFFKARAFAGRDLEENCRLVAFGKAIARKLNGSFFGAKIVGGIHRNHPIPNLWSEVLGSNIGGLSLLGVGIGYVADLTVNLLPSHVDMCAVTVSMEPCASQRALVMLQDLFKPLGSEACLTDTVSFPKVLLSKSVLPFCTYYYVANCTVGAAGPVRLAAEQPAEQGDNGLKHMSFEEGLLPVLRCSKEGSMVIITTNNRQVACIGTVEPIILKALPFPEYWFFFKAHAFAGRDLEENPRLVAFGKAIAKKLNGSFFGAKIIGVILRDNPIPNLWCKVLRSNIGDLSLLGDGVGYVEDLAENLLPSHVDMCRVTLSIEPCAPRRDLVVLQDLFKV